MFISFKKNPAGTFVLALSLLVSLPSGLFCQEALPGDPARIFYEKALRELLRDKPDSARDLLQQALPGGGPFSDLARLALLRLNARSKGEGAQIVAGIKDLLLQMEDQTRVPMAWYAAIQALEEYGHDEIALDQAHELALRFDQHALSDDALLIAARVLDRRRDYGAALDMIQQILSKRERADRRAEALMLQASIYLAPGAYQDAARACVALGDAQRLSEANSILWLQIEDERLLYCLPD